MFSIFIRLALTAALAALAAFVSSYWYQSFLGQEDYGFTKFLVSGGLLILCGLVVSVWSFRTRLFGLVMRTLLSMPFAGFIIFVIVWIRPTPAEPLVLVFFTGLCAVSVLLVAAMWSYRPKKL